MDHLPLLRSLMRDHFNLKMFLPNFFHWEKASSLYLKWFLAYKKSCTDGAQLRGGLAKYVRVDTRFQFTT